MLKIRQFTFRQHCVVSLAGSVDDLAALRDAIASRAQDAAIAVALAGLVPLDDPDGIALCAVSGPAMPVEPEGFHWPCLGNSAFEEVAMKLDRVIDGQSIEETFALLPEPAELLVELAPDEPH